MHNSNRHLQSSTPFYCLVHMLKNNNQTVAGTDLALQEIVLHRDTDAILSQRCDGIVCHSVDDGRQKQFPDWQQPSRLSGSKTHKTMCTFDETVKDAGLLTRYLRLQCTFIGANTVIYYYYYTRLMALYLGLPGELVPKR